MLQEFPSLCERLATTAPYELFRFEYHIANADASRSALSVHVLTGRNELLDDLALAFIYSRTDIPIDIASLFSIGRFKRTVRVEISTVFGNAFSHYSRRGERSSIGVPRDFTVIDYLETGLKVATLCTCRVFVGRMSLGFRMESVGFTERGYLRNTRQYGVAILCCKNRDGRKEMYKR